MFCISIIIPVYNAEQYLSQCIDSILLQLYKNVEVILIDDGSKDSSGIICDDYAKSTSCIRVIHKTNGGVSSARNRGIDEAKGDYVMFIDADDQLLPNTITPDLFARDVDMIQIPRNSGSRFREYDSDIILSDRNKTRKFVNENYNHECWGKIIKRNIIGDIRFKEGLRIGEDFLFMLEVYERLNSVYYVQKNKGGYSYNANENSAMSVLREDTDFGILQQALIPYMKKRNFIAWRFMVNHLYLSARTNMLKQLVEELRLFDILVAPIPICRKKEILSYKTRNVLGLNIIKERSV